MGSNCTLSVAAWPGFNVTGNVTPDTMKPAPVSAAALIVTGAVPVDVKVTDRVAAVFTTTLLNATLVALMLSVGTTSDTLALADFVESATLVAVTVTVCALVIEAGAV